MSAEEYYVIVDDAELPQAEVRKGYTAELEEFDVVLGPFTLGEARVTCNQMNEDDPGRVTL